jgi:uncharacterized protein (DUF1330 family)
MPLGRGPRLGDFIDTPTPDEGLAARYLVRRQPVEVLEGEWRPKRITLVEFPSKVRAKEFYTSREFRDVMEIRRRSAKTNLVLVEQPE